MSAGHTPGPWQPQSVRNVTVEGPCKPVVNPEGYPTAFVPAWEDAPDESMANARLIAAAPELLEACERAIETLAAGRHLVRKYAPAHHWMPEHEERITALKAAIAKATGAA